MATSCRFESGHRHQNMGYPNGVSHIFMAGVRQTRTLFEFGERGDRRLWRKQGAEPVAAIGEGRRLLKAEDIRRAPQQEHRHLIPQWSKNATESKPRGPRGKKKLKQETRAAVLAALAFFYRFLNTVPTGIFAVSLLDVTVNCVSPVLLKTSSIMGSLYANVTVTVFPLSSQVIPFISLLNQKS